MKSALRLLLLLASFVAPCFPTPLSAYGPLGYEIVGAIADERLANTPTVAKTNTLLDGLTLEKATVTADQIRGWDGNGADDPRSFHYSALVGVLPISSKGFCN